MTPPKIGEVIAYEVVDTYRLINAGEAYIDDIGWIVPYCFAHQAVEGYPLKRIYPPQDTK